MCKIISLIPISAKVACEETDLLNPKNLKNKLVLW